MKPENTTDALRSTDIGLTIHGNLAVVELLVTVKVMRCGIKLDRVFRNIRIFIRVPEAA